MSFYCRILCCCLFLFCLPVNAAAKDSQKVTLNFTNLDINTLIATVAEITKKTFIVDPRVKAEVTVVSSNPMDSEQVYQVFLSILSTHGYAAVPSGKVIKIVPDGMARSENTPVLAPNERGTGEETVTQIIKLQHIAAAQLIPLLRPLMPQQSHLVAYPTNNTLIISDRADNVTRLLKIIKRVDQVPSEEVEVILLEHASAAEVTRLLTTLEQKNIAAAAATGAVVTSSIVADERTNSVLITGDSSTRLRLRTLITHLDTPLKTVGNTQVIYLRYAQAKDLVAVLKGVSENITEQKKVEGGGQPSVPKEATKTTIQADPTTNALIITAAPDMLQNLQAVIRQLDIRRAQVLVEAIIAEISTDLAEELGVQWIIDGTPGGTGPVGLTNFNNAPGAGIIEVGSAVANIIRNNNSTSVPNVGAGAFLGLGRFNSSAFNFGILLRALSADTNTNVLSTPSLLTLDNQEAEIIVGQNVPFVTGQFTSTGAGTGVTNPFQTIQRQDVGLKLKVKPQINEGNSVKLEIEQEVSSITRSSVATADIVTNKRTIKTTVIVEDTKMVVLGGLMDEDLQQTGQKVPVLGDIPLIGGLFRSQSVKKTKRNLMVFLHPRILRDDGSEMAISTDKYSYMRIQQLEQKAEGLPLGSNEMVPVLSNLNDFLAVLPGGSAISTNILSPTTLLGQ